jgi:hypothetical protein
MVLVGTPINCSYSPSKASRPHYLEILAVQAHLAAFAQAPDEAIAAPDAQVHVTDDHLGTHPAEPAREMLRPGPGIEDKPARRIEHPRHHDLKV